MTTIVHHRCGNPSTSLRDGAPWCLTCECWLTQCELTGEWVSPAERLRRQTQARNDQLIEQTRCGALDALDLVRTLIPDRWRAEVTQIAPSAWTLHLHPPTAAIDVYAYLTAPHSGQDEGWYVRVNNRTRGVNFPLYIAGGARAAHYARVQDAVAEAVHAVCGERYQSR